MKNLGRHVAIFALMAFCAGEICAQNKSSASQMVTFGVRRLAPQMLKDNIVHSSSVDLAQTVPPAVKISIGSDLSSANASATSVTKVENTRTKVLLRDDNVDLLSAKLSSARASKTVITLTD